MFEPEGQVCTGRIPRNSKDLAEEQPVVYELKVAHFRTTVQIMRNCFPDLDFGITSSYLSSSCTINDYFFFKRVEESGRLTCMNTFTM